MKSAFFVAMGVSLLMVMVGCDQEETREVSGPETAPVSIGGPLGSIEVGDQAVCVICAIENESHGVEEVKATLDYEGKTYGFCSEAEKAEFISSPGKYVGTEG